MTARDELDQIRQRHDEDHEHPAGEVCDNRAMVAALTAALDLADGMDARDDVYAEQEHPNETVAIEAVPVHELRTAITDHLRSDRDE